MSKTFNRYQTFVIAALAFLQFTIILDFMVLSPLSAFLLPELHITTGQFGMVVSAYAWSAGISGLLAAGFADKYDRKKMQMIFYTGFLLGTLLCGLAPTYEFLMGARIVTGIFGGVIGSVVFAIVTDLFPMEVRGRVMGFLQMSFAGAQVLGLPIGLYLNNIYGWHSPFLMIVGLGIPLGVLLLLYLKPVDAHLTNKMEKSALKHLAHTFVKPDYLKTFMATTLLATGGFMLMQFGSAFAINNLKLTAGQLPTLYMITGVFSMFTAPLIGKLADSWGKYTVFSICSFLVMLVVIFYCNLEVTPFWIVVCFSVFMFINVSGRMISSSALFSGIPSHLDRGAFMAINSAVQMVSGGIASMVAGMIVHQTDSGYIEHYPILGYVVAGATFVTVIMMYFINQMVMKRTAAPTPTSAAAPVPAEAPSH
jgi:predicted MFS family arabinose efflux permease